MNRVLFLTSSTREMFEFSGRKLLNSFYKFKDPQSKMIYITENFTIPFHEYPDILQDDLSGNLELKEWLDENKDIIPKSLGGFLDDNKIFKTQILGKGKNRGFNFKASLWFRKVIAVRLVINKYMKDFDLLIWIDNDCEILKFLDNNFYNSLFKNNEQNVFVCYGENRKIRPCGVETGFFGIRNDFTIWKDLFQLFKSKEFKKSDRWGDGNVLGYLLNQNNNMKKYKVNDLGKGKLEFNIMNSIPQKDYLVHYKGLHRRNRIDFKN